MWRTDSTKKHSAFADSVGQRRQTYTRTEPFMPFSESILVRWWHLLGNLEHASCHQSIDKTYECLPMGSLLVSWSLASTFSTNMAISETKGQGWRAILTH